MVSITSSPRHIGYTYCAMSEFALTPHPKIPKADGPVMVCILDGWGVNPIKDEFNAINVAATPVMDSLETVSALEPLGGVSLSPPLEHFCMNSLALWFNHPYIFRLKS